MSVNTDEKALEEEKSTSAQNPESQNRHLGMPKRKPVPSAAGGATANPTNLNTTDSKPRNSTVAGAREKWLNWWSLLSTKRRRLFIGITIGAVTIVIVALVIGLSVGLTVGRR